MSRIVDEFEPGQRVVVIQQIPQRDEVWTHRTEGLIVRFEQRKTGSWFAHAKDDRLWLDRLVLRKDDGEVVTFNCDRYTRVELVDDQGQGAPAVQDQADAEAGPPGGKA